MYISWLDSTGRLDVQLAVRGVAVVPFVFREGDRIVFEGEAKVETCWPVLRLVG